MTKAIWIPFIAIGLSVLFWGAPSSSWSQGKAAPSFGIGSARRQEQVDATMKALRVDLKRDTRGVISKYLNLTPHEAKGFWGVYDDYEKDMDQLDDRTRKLIADYAEAYKEGELSQLKAEQLLSETVDVDRSRDSLRQAYVGKFLKVVSVKTVARFYQLENKIHAIEMYDLAVNIPLVR